jgi:hypothetical protein
MSPFTHVFGRGIKGKRTTKGSCIHPPPNPKEKGLKTTSRKSPRKGSENHQKGKPGRTQTSLEEPRRIIYTYHEGSYKVYLSPDDPTLVTEPPKIIVYYRLSLSTWPLSNNKELLSRFRRVKPGESLTTGSRYALSPHQGGTRVQH